jgi:probable rRNA maturation factor
VGDVAVPNDPDRARLLVDVVARAADRPVTRGLSAWLAATAPVRLRGAVTVALLADRAVRTLNLRYRGIDSATDVLSFPAIAHATSGPVSAARRRRTVGTRGRPAARPVRSVVQRWGPASLRSPGPVGAASLGEIAIARGVAERQARVAGHAFSTELRVLALHGLLHLAGYDHERDDGEMARVEARLRRKGGLPGGLIERAAAPGRQRREARHHARPEGAPAGRLA